MRHNGPLQDPSNLYVLIPNLISQIAILLVKICLIPTIASTFLTITFFILFFSCSGFSNVLPSRFSARLPQLSYIPLEQFILRGVRSFHFHGCVQFVSLPTLLVLCVLHSKSQEIYLVSKLSISI